MSDVKKSKRQLEKEAYEKLPPDQKLRKDIYDWIMSMLIALVACVALFVFFVRIIDVSTGLEIVSVITDELCSDFVSLLFRNSATHTCADPATMKLRVTRHAKREFYVPVFR